MDITPSSFGQLSELIGLGVKYVWYYPVVFLCIYYDIMFTYDQDSLSWVSTIDLIVENMIIRMSRVNHYFQALMAALSGTIGLGNIAGVALQFL